VPEESTAGEISILGSVRCTERYEILFEMAVDRGKTVDQGLLGASRGEWLTQQKEQSGVFVSGLH
jgi:hypothetical protein